MTQENAQFLDIFATFATDEDAEKSGVWRDLGPSKLLIARSGNRAYARMLTAEVDQARAVLDMKGTDAADNASDEIMAKVMAHTILLDWKNVGTKGKLLPYSKANAEMLLRTKDFRVKVQQLSDEFAAYKAKQEEEQGNS